MLRSILAAVLALAVGTSYGQIVNRPVAAGAISSPGTSAPSTCAVGNLFFKSNATAGQNLQLCTSANTWTGIADGSGAGSFTTLTTSSTTTLSPANANVVLSPTGTGVVTINPATAGTLNNVAIGGTTPLAGTFTTLSGSSTFSVTGTGPHSLGTTTLTDRQLQIGGSFTTAQTSVYGTVFGTTIVPAANGTAYGVYYGITMNKAGSGTHADFAEVLIDTPVIGAGAATLTNSTALKIVGPPSVGTNLRSLWVNAGLTQLDGPLARTLATETNAARTVSATDTHIIANRAGTITLTLPTATAGRELTVRTITANTVISASSNVVPCVGGSAGTAILAATAGKWAMLVADGTNWQIQMCN